MSLQNALPISEPSSAEATIELLIIGPYPAWDMQPLEAGYSVHKLWEQADPDVYLAEHGANIRAIATRGELGASAELMSKLPRLEIVSCYGVGTDAIDLAEARRRGIRVTNTPLVLNKDVADMALALTLAVLRQIPAGDRYVRDGSWAAKNMGLTASLTGKRIGILGFGRIGHEVAKRAAAFDTEVGYSDLQKNEGSSYTYFTSPTALAGWADVLIVTVSGGAATHHIVNAEVIEALGPTGIVINVSRGSTVDENALLAALEAKSIAGAGLDVFATEPKINPRFFPLDNVTLQPHHASGTVETRKAMGQLVRDNLQAYFAGESLLTPVV